MKKCKSYGSACPTGTDSAKGEKVPTGRAPRTALRALVQQDFSGVVGTEISRQRAEEWMERTPTFSPRNVDGKGTV